MTFRCRMCAGELVRPTLAGYMVRVVYTEGLLDVWEHKEVHCCLFPDSPCQRYFVRKFTLEGHMSSVTFAKLPTTVLMDPPYSQMQGMCKMRLWAGGPSWRCYLPMGHLSSHAVYKEVKIFIDSSVYTSW